MAAKGRSKMGRPKLFSGVYTDAHVHIPTYLVEWARGRGENLSVVVRDALRDAYQRDQAARRRRQQAGLSVFPEP